MNERLWGARKRRGLTQAQLAKAVGVGQSDLSRIERGWNPPDDIQAKLAEALDVSVAELFPPAVPTGASSPSSAGVRS